MQIPRFKWSMNKCSRARTHTHNQLRSSARIYCTLFEKCVNFINSILPLQTLCTKNTLSCTPTACYLHGPFFFDTHSTAGPVHLCALIWHVLEKQRIEPWFPSAWKCNYVPFRNEPRIWCGDVGSLQKSELNANSVCMCVCVWIVAQTLFTLAIAVVATTPPLVDIVVIEIRDVEIGCVHTYMRKQCVRLHLCLNAINIKCDLWHYMSILCEKGI